MRKCFLLLGVFFSFSSFATEVNLKPSEITLEAIDGWFGDNYLVIRLPKEEVRIHYPDFYEALDNKEYIEKVIHDAERTQKNIHVNVDMLYLASGHGIEIGFRPGGSMILLPAAPTVTPKMAIKVDEGCP